MPPTPESTASAEGALLPRLTRRELGDAYVRALRAALAGATRKERQRFWELPALLPYHAEFRRRSYEEELIAWGDVDAFGNVRTLG